MLKQKWAASEEIDDLQGFNVFACLVDYLSTYSEVFGLCTVVRPAILFGARKRAAKCPWTNRTFGHHCQARVEDQAQVIMPAPYVFWIIPLINKRCWDMFNS